MCVGRARRVGVWRSVGVVVVKTAVFSAGCAVCVVGALVSALGRLGLTVGLAAVGVVLMVLASLAAKKERSDGVA